MCPQASGSGVKYAWRDQDTIIVSENPPVQNTWYGPTGIPDMRLLVYAVHQKNDEAAAKDLEVRWQFDGYVCGLAFSAADDQQYYIYRTKYPGGSGLELATSVNPVPPMLAMLDKRAQDADLEVRMTSVPGTSQTLDAWCVVETLEVT